MNAWVKEHLRDEQTIRSTMSKVAAVAGVVGFFLVLIGAVVR